MLLSICVGILVCSLFLIASFVQARKAQSSLNKGFANFTIATGIWVTANYIGANFKSHNFAHYFIHGDFFSGTFLVLTLWLFSLAIFDQTENKGKYIKLQHKLVIPYSVLTVIAAATTFLPSVLKITYSHSTTTTTYNNGFLFYAAALLILVLSSLANIFVSLFLAKGLLKQQISIMVSGLIAAIVFLASTNLLLPLITNSKNTNLIAGNLAYLGLLLFVGATFYSIVKRRLFNLRLIIARTIAYALFVSVYTVLYVMFAILISTVFVKDYKTNGRQLFVTVTLMILLISTNGPIRRFIDKLTNRVFYRDAYDTQTFLDSLNQIIIDNIEIGILLRHTSKVIQDNLKSEQVGFILGDQNPKSIRFIDSNGFVKQTNDLTSIYSEALKTKQRFIISDEIDGEKLEKMRQLMWHNRISMIIQLQTPNKVDNHEANLLVIGDKKSGNSYSSGDVKIIDIIANELVIAIQNALRFEEIQSFNVTLQQRVNEATRKLRKANDRLKELDETKDDFISMASHQLRTPLTSIKGYVSMILEGDAGKINSTQHEMLGQAFFSSQRMVYLIADMLNVSRLKTGKFAIENSNINLAEVVEQEMEQLKETAASHGVKLTYTKPKDFPNLMLDETKIRQVIMNFADNAIYYTPKDGNIEVHLQDNPGTIELTVKDDGIGVPKAERHHLFTKFYRAGNARKIRPDGTGIGLYMAKKVIMAQGGSIIFDSEEGKGSTFGFIINKKSSEPKSQPVKPKATVAKETVKV
jgi:signal transduction histidine kinase